MNINDKLTQDLAKAVEQVIEGKEENIEEAFMRLPSTVIGTDLFVLQRDLKDFMYSQMKNRDFNPKQFDDMIKRMEKIKKSAKKFNKASDMGPEFKYRSN
jgi:DNA repair ATPase RecN